MLKTNIIIKAQFEALHYWTDAESVPEVAFLKYPHRHIFHIIMKWKVSHNDRDIEFIIMKRKVIQYIELKYTKAVLSKSCEMIATELLNHFNAVYVSVFEDNENGAEVYNV